MHSVVFVIMPVSCVCGIYNSLKSHIFYLSTSAGVKRSLISLMNPYVKSLSKYLHLYIYKDNNHGNSCLLWKGSMMPTV